MDTKQTSLLVLVVFLVIGGFWFFGGSSAPEESVQNTTQSTGTEISVVLTEDGYVPNELAIKLGDTLVFSTVGTRHFWPASNLHPSHRDYPAFDPREPILPEETWSFTFTQTGEWKFHDHLAPYYSGVIIVSE